MTTCTKVHLTLKRRDGDCDESAWFSVVPSVGDGILLDKHSELWVVTRRIWAEDNGVFDARLTCEVAWT